MRSITNSRKKADKDRVFGECVQADDMTQWRWLLASLAGGEWLYQDPGRRASGTGA